MLCVSYSCPPLQMALRSPSPESPRQMFCEFFATRRVAKTGPPHFAGLGVFVLVVRGSVRTTCRLFGLGLPKEFLRVGHAGDNIEAQFVSAAG